MRQGQKATKHLPPISSPAPQAGDEIYHADALHCCARFAFEDGWVSDLRAFSRSVMASFRHWSASRSLLPTPEKPIHGLSPGEVEYHLAVYGRNPGLSLSQRTHPKLPRGDSSRPKAYWSLLWVPLPIFWSVVCPLPVPLSHALSSNPVSKKTGSSLQRAEMQTLGIKDELFLTY